MNVKVFFGDIFKKLGSYWTESNHSFEVKILYSFPRILVLNRFLIMILPSLCIFNAPEVFGFKHQFSLA